MANVWWFVLIYGTVIQLSECVTRFTMNVSHLFFNFFFLDNHAVSIHNKTVVLQKFMLKRSSKNNAT